MFDVSAKIAAAYPTRELALRAIVRLEAGRDTSQKAQDLVDEQAEDEALWFLSPTASEAYLQQALRKLHAVIESGGR